MLLFFRASPSAMEGIPRYSMRAEQRAAHVDDQGMPVMKGRWSRRMYGGIPASSAGGPRHKTACSVSEHG